MDVRCTGAQRTLYPVQNRLPWPTHTEDTIKRYLRRQVDEAPCTVNATGDACNVNPGPEPAEKRPTARRRHTRESIATFQQPLFFLLKCVKINRASDYIAAMSCEYCMIFVIVR